jgi:hypothetical protein
VPDVVFGVSVAHTSAPRDAPLELDSAGVHHLLVAESETQTTRRLIADAARLRSAIEILGHEDGADASERRPGPHAEATRTDRQLAARLSAASVGVRLYVSGREAFVRRLVQTANRIGLSDAEIRTLDWLRVESALLFYPYDNSERYPFDAEGPGDTLWELGLDFTVTPGKTGFRGHEEHQRLRGRERFKIFGVLLEGSQAAAEGDIVWAAGKQIGVITCAMYSRLTRRSMAIARLAVHCAVAGTAVSITGSISATGAAHSLPFDDPSKSKRTATD